MATLIAADALKERLSLSDITEVDQACSVAVTLTTQLLQARLQCDFERLARAEHFRILCPLKTGEEYRTTLVLSVGMVSTTPAPVIRIGSAPAEADAADAISDDDCTINAERGLVEVRSGESLLGKVASVSYTSGYDESGGKYEDVPPWLSEIAYAEATVQLYSKYPQYKPDNVTADMLTSLKADVKTLLSGKNRYGGAGAVHPI